MESGGIFYSNGWIIIAHLFTIISICISHGFQLHVFEYTNIICRSTCICIIVTLFDDINNSVKPVD